MQPEDRAAASNLVGLWLTESWWPIVATALLPISATICITVGQELADKGDWAWFVSGALQLLVVAAVQVAAQLLRTRMRDRGLCEADRLRVAMKDALQRVAELLATMPSMNKQQRISELKRVVSQAIGAIHLLLDNVDRLRVVVYEVVDPATGRMEMLDYSGRQGSAPQPFVPGTRRGDLAINMVLEGKTVFTRDVDRDPPEDYQGSKAGYKTFIASAITNGDDAYGMVTADAPNAGDLVDTDKQIVMLVADLLAIGFAERERER